MLKLLAHNSQSSLAALAGSDAHGADFFGQSPGPFEIGEEDVSRESEVQIIAIADVHVIPSDFELKRCLDQYRIRHKSLSPVKRDPDRVTPDSDLLCATREITQAIRSRFDFVNHGLGAVSARFGYVA